jgi:hypothetical protein
MSAGIPTQLADSFTKESLSLSPALTETMVVFLDLPESILDRIIDYCTFSPRPGRADPRMGAMVITQEFIREREAFKNIQSLALTSREFVNRILPRKNLEQAERAALARVIRYDSPLARMLLAGNQPSILYWLRQSRPHFAPGLLLVAIAMHQKEVVLEMLWSRAA